MTRTSGGLESLRSSLRLKPAGRASIRFKWNGDEVRIEAVRTTDGG